MNTLSIVANVKQFPNNRPRHFSCQLWVTLTLDIQATRPHHPPLPPPHFLWQQSLLMIWGDNHTVLSDWFAKMSMLVKPPHCAAACWTRPGVLSVKSKAVPAALWQNPLPLEPLIITCEGGLVIFLIILHFISIPPFKTQHENWLPQRSIFIISSKAHKLSNILGAWVDEAGTSRSLSEQSHILAELNGAALLCAENGREKKYTCYLVNPQTCKIGISWMSATEMELTRDLFIVTEGH